MCECKKLETAAVEADTTAVTDTGEAPAEYVTVDTFNMLAERIDMLETVLTDMQATVEALVNSEIEDAMSQVPMVEDL